MWWFCFADTAHQTAFYASTLNRKGDRVTITGLSLPARDSSAQVGGAAQRSNVWVAPPLIRECLSVHRVQDTLVWSRWCDRKRRLWDPQWPPEHLPRRNLPSANSHRGPDHLWGACLQHLWCLFKVRWTAPVRIIPRHQTSDEIHLFVIIFLSSLLKLWRHPWVRLCKCRSGEQELCRLQGQIYMSRRVLWRYSTRLKLFFKI